jgi:hypothetical protein
MRKKRDAGPVLNSTAGPLPTPVWGHKIPLSANPPNRTQVTDTLKAFDVERMIFGRRKTFFP